MDGQEAIDVDAFTQQLNSVRGIEAAQREQFAMYSKERLAHDKLSDNQMQQRCDLQRTLYAQEARAGTGTAARDRVRGVGGRNTGGNECGDLESECGDVDVLEHDDDGHHLCA